MNLISLLFTVYCLLFTVLGGCASLSQKEKILAVVDGGPVTEGDLEYSLNIAHRREDLSSAGALNLSQYVQKLIDDRLIIEEARRMGLDKSPEVQQSIQAYILRESVVRLYNEEIGQKVSVTEKDIEDYYKKNYERFTVGVIEVKSEEEAKEILEQLKKGGNFKELAEKYSTHVSKKDGGEVVLARNSMSPIIEEAVSGLKPEEFSGVLKIQDKYYIVKLIGRKEAPDEELEKVRRNIERAIRKQKEKERSDEYLKYLRARATIKINNELLSAIKPDGGSEEIEKLSKDKSPLAEVNGSILTVGDFIAMAAPVKPYGRKLNEEILNNWIDRKVVDHAALSRHYEMKLDLKIMLNRYEDQLLKNVFIRRVVLPRISISDKTLEEYYSAHQKSFIRPAHFKIQQITVKTKDEAEDILNNLKNGADFSWVATRRSTDPAASKGGDAGWLTKAELPESAREIIDALKPGDISPVIKIDSLYRIIRLIEKTGEEVEPFDKVKDTVYRACFDDQLKDILNKYLQQLKTESQIKIYDKEIRSLEEKLQKK